MHENQKVEIKIPSLSEYVGVVRLAASGIANRLKFNHEEIEDIKIAVSEACTNAVQYAYPGKLGEIEIVFVVKKDQLEVIVKDNGRGFDINRPASGSENNPDLPEKVGLGLGITFMKSLMDEVEYDSEIGRGTIVKLVKYVYSTDAIEANSIN
ncbi:MAG: hypothetical protein DKM50_12795 [Candidatus Margulisiibacteriota bacterium]|nr:MAG: hypothetical protein A2X43_01225 [Candidatus Margulisbacteria bacterium GWD2_39_127]OGI05360.1 MAG: hypothetical protein A2X42_05905 [Candidatus Margulisbacteria bacterium GWF2_38_17]OGI05817.1 MAG: hypothetical protein A2X41_02765 [Candidatus Margulisbacteria bacterium GWE2_39_32]PZM77412.1 MAG: hypothetical protein DKM50_12795 [Candidatus Margulisiibacteriota bacterium]HAR62279.1 hypothetical protein [Candidatus Margulisiibacteriota bacterium]